MFKETFKFYKSRTTTPDFSEVLDFDTINPNDDRIKKYETLNTKNIETFLGLISPSKWECYELKQRPGLIFIKNPFTAHGQRYWLTRSIRDYPKCPNVVNLNPKQFTKNEIDDWWTELQNCKDDNHRKKLKNSMRWSTLGYHHDWDTKIYSEKMKNKFPPDLAELIEYFAKILKFGRYSAEAAIVNYYPIGTTLAGHTDHSESDLHAPLFSLSFGQTAIFLIGGPTKDEKPVALFLKSGDVTVMSKDSRLCYHAVPRVMKCKTEPWNYINLYKDETYIEELHELQNCKKAKLEINVLPTSIDNELWNECTDENFWKSFNLYLQDSRVNINIRQVLKEGQHSL